MNPQIPIGLKLKKKVQKELAYIQDITVKELYNVFPEAILHGGTAIWRCYNGNRFSDDIDIYIPKDEEKINILFKNLENKGFKIIKKRVKENSFYSELTLDSNPIKIEATFQTKKHIFKSYETSENTFINVYTLTPEDLIIEKVAAYLNRKKIRDLYDIFFLLNYAQNNKIQEYLKKLIKHFVKPKDEKGYLAAVIISGAVPNSEQLLEGIKRWVK